MPGPLELAILGYLWDNGPRTTAQIQHALADSYRRLGQSTVARTVLKMAEKGYVTALPPRGYTKVQRGLPNLYRAALTRAELAEQVAEPIWEA